MKTKHLYIIAPVVLVAFIGAIWFFGCRKPASSQPSEVWHTNSVQMWTTNTIDRWLTNTVMVEHTNTVVQTVTKEVPARLSAQEKQEGMAGSKYLSAPALAAGAGALYKVGPLAAAAEVDPSAAETLTEGSAPARKALDATLAAKNIPVATNGPQQLRLVISQSASFDQPRVAAFSLTLELRETATLQRQTDMVKSPALVWSTKSSALVREGFASQDLKDPVQEIIGRFCSEYSKAKESQKEIESRLPAPSSLFLQ